MKKLMLIAILLIAVISCKKEETKPCNCGTIANDGIDLNGCHWLEIRNACTGNKKKFCFDADVWMNANVGENFCVTNQEQW